MSDRITALKNLGPIGFLNDFIYRQIQPENPYLLRSRYLKHPVRVRPQTSDWLVFQQIFRHREYRCLDAVKRAELIIDCGANVGYSSAYFLSRFPNAHVIAVEPDPDNFSALRYNLEPYKPRFTALNTGIWSRTTRLLLSEEDCGAGNEWGRTVREARDNESGGFQATDIGAIFESTRADRISILKIDIEGSEKEVFSNPTPWLSKVDNLVIELHGTECESAFFEAIRAHSFTVETCDELTVCRRIGKE